MPVCAERTLPQREKCAEMQIHISKRLKSKSINPTRYIVLGFGAIILLGTLLLHLPVAARDGLPTPWLTCLFTATSATCVTGLVLVDTAVHWSWFGQAVILLLLQLGGLGFVTLISIVPFALNQRIGLSQRLVMASAMNLDRVAGVVRVVRHALLGTLCVEGVGAVLLALRFVPQFGLKGIWFSIFHSVSAFCNGGFDILGLYSGPYSSLASYQGDPLVLGTIMALIVIGGLGFFVWEDLIQKRCWKKLTLYSKMVLGITAVLIVLGTVYFFCAEWDNPTTLGNMPLWQRPLNALFQSVTLRTAGYATFDMGGLREGSAVMSIILMLIGGSSGSTAGGLKTVTVGILLLALRDGLRGRDQVVFRGRMIPGRKVLDAMTLALTVVLLFLSASMLLSLIDQVPYVQAAFEVASAMGTVGVTMGITPSLSVPSALLVILLMFLGRVGILSFSIAFLTRGKERNKITYPAAEVMVG